MKHFSAKEFWISMWTTIELALYLKKQRKLINEGMQEVNCEDQATRVCLKATAKCGTNIFKT
eukprot:4930519-Karenia_brevis.AAC.1